MVDIEEGATQKRKASPSSPVDDGGSKRHKIEEAHDRGNGVKEDYYGDNAPDSATPNIKAEASSEQLSTPSTERTSLTREELLHPDRRRVIDGEKPTLQHLPRKNPSQEEKKRGQRLFGGLLTTLSQTTANPQQKRRMEIQLRQKERASEQRAEDQRRRVEKQRKLDHARRLEQVEFDEQLVRSPPVGWVLEAVLTRAGQMRTRHANMLALARSLRTKSVPRLVRAKERASPLTRPLTCISSITAPGSSPRRKSGSSKIRSAPQRKRLTGKSKISKTKRSDGSETWAYSGLLLLLLGSSSSRTRSVSPTTLPKMLTAGRRRRPRCKLWISLTGTRWCMMRTWSSTNVDDSNHSFRIGNFYY